MDATVFLRGMILGFSIAAPVGPIGVLCIRRTLSFGRLAGFVSGMGAASADAVYGSIAAFGLTSAVRLLAGQQGWMRLAGGLFLVYLGLRTFFARPEATGAGGDGSRQELVGFYASTLFLTLTNPMTILSFAAIFAGLGLGSGSGGYGAPALMVLGVFCGSALWWLLLSGGTGLLRRFLKGGGLTWINRLSGAVILAFGATALTAYFWG
ncbi:MAG: LysE family transporter [Anaerolineae bacterium]|nr:LysE family transporter [Anaerolineae bacterium]